MQQTFLFQGDVSYKISPAKLDVFASHLYDKSIKFNYKVTL